MSRWPFKANFHKRNQRSFKPNQVHSETRLEAGFLYDPELLEKTVDAASGAAGSVSGLADSLKNNIPAISGNSTEFLGNLSALFSQANYATQTCVLTGSFYNAGASLIDCCVCPNIVGKSLYIASAVCSTGSALTTTGTMISNRYASPYSYALGGLGFGLRKVAKYTRKLGDANNPLKFF